MHPQFSSFGRRVLAIIVDSIILSSIINISLMAVLNFDINIIIFLLPFLYYVLFYSLWNGQTIGKHLLSIRVIKINNEPMDVGTSIIRTLGEYVSALPIGLGYLWAAWDKNNQTWHDKIAKTYVIKTEGTSKKTLSVVIFSLFVLIGILSLYLQLGFLLSDTIPKMGEDGTNNLTETPVPTNSLSDASSVKPALNLPYIKYDGSGDGNIIKKFNSSSLKDLQSNSQTLGENFVDVGDGNINVATDDFVLDNKSNVYIKLTTDSEISAFIFKTDSLHKFLSNSYPTFDPLAKQDPKNFLPLENIKSSYTERTLEAGNYSVVYIPTKKAVTINSVIKAE